MKLLLNPTSLGSTPRGYTHGILVAGPSDIVYVSGQVGEDPDGNVPADFKEQARLAWKNVEAVLVDAEMSLGEIVKVTAYLINADDRQDFAEIREEFLKRSKPASTLVYVSGLASPAYRVEIDVIASRSRRFEK